jgi:hypothetical protein
MKASQLLIQAKALITDPEHWTQGVYARTHKDGQDTNSYHPEAVCFCSLGALHRVTKDPLTFEAYYMAKRRLSKAMGHQSIAGFNDTHPHAEVMVAWDEAIALAIAEGD